MNNILSIIRSICSRCSGVILLLSLTGCAQFQAKQQPVLKIPTSWAAQQQTITSLNNWSIQGKLGFHTVHDNGTATILWQQGQNNLPQHYGIDLYGPLNLDNVHIAGDQHLVSLTAADGTKLTGQSPEALVREYAGWELPISGLWYWVRGLPVPGAKVEKITVDQRNLAKYIKQFGWEIIYHRYQTFSDYTLPVLLSLKHDKLNINLKLAIRIWKL